MKKSTLLAAASALFGIVPAVANVDCLETHLAVMKEASAEQSKVLEIVEARVAATPDCSCEIVKAAIEAVVADSATVAAIVETAIAAAPEHIRLIAQCAVAVAPDALADVQTILAKYDPASGEGYSGKSAKSGKAPAGEVASMGNPLDFPGKGPVGPFKGGPFGPIFPVFPPIIINPPNVTDVNPPGPPFTPPGPPQVTAQD